MMLAEPVLHIAAHEWKGRAGSRPRDAVHTIAIYSNLLQVELLIDGVSLGKAAPVNATVRFDVPLVDGRNVLEARGERDGQVFTDRVEIEYQDRQPFFADAGSRVREIAVNAGGHYDVVDETGRVWEAGRDYEPGSWGRMGGKPVLTHHRIFDTDLDPLWQDTWEGADHWRFDVPDGDYMLELGFVEVEHGKPEARVFDVVVNGETKRHGLDLAASPGRYVPLRVVIPVTVAGGDGIVIEMPARARDNTLSTIRLQRK